MEEQQQRIAYLVQQYMNKACSRQELEELTAIAAGDKNNAVLRETMEFHWKKILEDQPVHPANWDIMFNNMMVGAGKQVPRQPAITRSLVWKRSMMAAAVLLCIATGVYFLLNRSGTPQVATVAPGKSGAILILADGATLMLDTAANGQVASQGNMQVIKRDGQLSYEPAGMAGVPNAWNTIQTPRGRQFQLTLADGTRVWLNAESSLRFPASFNDKERRVELKGEGYFEVSKGTPFHVMADNRADITVLGTHFNINAYNDDELIRTTLLEGSVLTGPSNTPGKAVRLAAGQQALMDKGGAMQVNDKVDDDQIVAWKNGNFQFDNERLDNIMKQVARWYDVDIVYKDDVKAFRFGGVMSRKENVSRILDYLSMTETIHFSIEGKKIIISK